MKPGEHEFAVRHHDGRNPTHVHCTPDLLAVAVLQAQAARSTWAVEVSSQDRKAISIRPGVWRVKVGKLKPVEVGGLVQDAIAVMTGYTQQTGSPAITKL